MDENQLIALALSVRKQAYAPYSNFKVGAAVLTKDGSTYVGCNVENSSFGLSICAERHAIGNMISSGQRAICKIVVAASPLASPCGACRQFIIEFGTDIEVVSFDAEQPSEIRRWTSAELLPDFFKFKDQD